MNKFKFQKKQAIKFYSIISHLFWLSVLLAIAATLSMAMFYQYFYNELPCPLCLLQRAALIGIGYGAMLHFRGVNYIRVIGLVLLFVFLLEIISVRQSLINIYPRPNHAWIGSSVLGMHMPVWCFIISTSVLLFIATEMIFIEPNSKISILNFKLLNKLASFLSWSLILICLANFISVFLQCSIYACHTYSYRLLA